MTASTGPIAPSTDRTTRLLLISQGEGVTNRYANLTRRSLVDEGGLSAQGWEAANALADWLHAHEQIDFLASCSHLRSRLTAQRISQILGIPLSLTLNLPHADVKETPVPPDQESADLVSRQTQEAVGEMLADHGGQTVALVSHRQGIATLISGFFGAHTLDFQIDDTSLSELRWQENRWRLIYLNRRDHLPAPVLQPAASPAAHASNGEEYAHLKTVRTRFNQVAAVYARSKQEADLQRIQHLVRFANLPKDLDILDVGSGPGTLALALAEAGARQVWGVDISEAMLEQAEYLRLTTAAPSHAHVSFRLASAHNLPFPDGRFNAVFCRLVLQYLNQPQGSVREMVRVLKPGGYLILAELLSADDPVKRATQNAIEERRDPGHVAARSAEQYRKLMAEAGLTVERSEIVTFEREVDEWLSSLDARPEDRTAVREMLEAGLETDAAGINARQRGKAIYFDQRMIYLKATKA